jgi:microcystin-dependent protein
MSEPFLGEIVATGFYFGSGFDPNTWLPCDGRLLSVQQNTALFSLIGTYYGGDGVRTFALPNLNGKVAISQGHGPGLTPRVLGEQVGAKQVTLVIDTMPKHNHQMQLGQSGATGATPGPGAPGTTAAINPAFNGFVAGNADTMFAQTAVGFDGGSIPHPNDQPNTSLWYLICTAGVFPSFN